MPREFPRSRRVEEAIQRILSEAIAGRVRDPRLSGVIVTNVSVSRDLSVARVYYSLLSGELPGPEIGKGLQAASGFLRTALAGELRVRHVPELRFYPDEALARSRSLEALIEQAVAGERKPGDSEPSGGAGD
jgi:ribosome-binding factor A